MVNANDYKWINGNLKYLFQYREYLKSGNPEIKNQIMKKCNFDVQKTIYSLVVIGMCVKGTAPKFNGLQLLYKFKSRVNRKCVEEFFMSDSNSRMYGSYYTRGMYLCGLISLFELKYQISSVE